MICLVVSFIIDCHDCLIKYEKCLNVQDVYKLSSFYYAEIECSWERYDEAAVD